MSGKNRKNIEAALPHLKDNEDIAIAADSLDNYEALEAMSHSEGGRYLTKKKINEASNTLQMLFITSRKAHEHIELLHLIAKIEAAIDIISELKNAEHNANEQRKIVDSIIESAS